jgi:hypothetical protein
MRRYHYYIIDGGSSRLKSLPRYVRKPLVVSKRDRDVIVTRERKYNDANASITFEGRNKTLVAFNLWN